jgi:DNA-binding NarL/FixJ family response regulator
MTTVIVADDHPVFRRGIVTLLESHGFDVIGEAAGVAEVVALVARRPPDVVVLDLGLPDGSGVRAAEQIRGLAPEVHIVVVTMFDDEGSVRESLQAGASGYVVKDASADQIVAAVTAVASGSLVLGPGVGEAGSRMALASAAAVDPFGLTPREREILDLLTRGLTNRQIAERLGLAGKTVSNLVSSVLAKLGAGDRLEAAQIARVRLGG